MPFRHKSVSFFSCVVILTSVSCVYVPDWLTSVYKNQWFAMLRTEFENDNGYEPETSNELVDWIWTDLVVLYAAHGSHALLLMLLWWQTLLFISPQEPNKDEFEQSSMRCGRKLIKDGDVSLFPYNYCLWIHFSKGKTLWYSPFLSTAGGGRALTLVSTCWWPTQIASSSSRGILWVSHVGALSVYKHEDTWHTGQWCRQPDCIIPL